MLDGQFSFSMSSLNYNGSQMAYEDQISEPDLYRDHVPAVMKSI